MEIEQIVKRVDWLDDERRKDKNLLGSLDERLNSLEGRLTPLTQQLKDIESGITRFSTLVGRMDQYDETLLQHRIEVKQAFDDLEKQSRKRDEDAEKLRRVEMRGVEATLVELRKELIVIPELKRGLQSRFDEEARLGRAIDEVRARLDSIRHSEEEYTRTFRLLEDGRRQDAKRLTDLQGEITAFRKHLDDQRSRIDLNSTAIKKIEARHNELSILESERREAQEKFLENQTLLHLERERIWKDWQARFEAIERQTADLDKHLEALDATHRAVKRSQQSLDDLGTKVDRRVNEMAEIQRLSEERFRQEWVTFKADDQKRWTNYTLTQEEQRG